MNIRRTLIAILTTLLATLALVEGGLRLIDPWRIGDTLSDIVIGNTIFAPDAARGYVNRAGTWHFNRWTMTILPDHTRAVPDTNPRAACTLALVGDSVTAAVGVDDTDTWANGLARALPDVHVINAGTGGYNVQEAEKTIRHIHASAYLYLLFDNDWDASITVPWDAARDIDGKLMLYWYATWHNQSQASRLPDDVFYGALAHILNNPQVTVVTFDGTFGGALRQRYPAVTLIQWYTHRVSVSNVHANAAGNREIAAALLPLARAAVDRACPII